MLTRYVLITYKIANIRYILMTGNIVNIEKMYLNDK